MKKQPIEITKRMTESLWNLHNEKPINTTIQSVRLSMTFLSLSNENKMEHDITPKNLYQNAYTYIDVSTNKRKYLMNETLFNKMIKNYKTNIWKYDSQTNIIHLNLNPFYEIYHKNYLKKNKGDENYKEYPFIKISGEEWDIMKSSYENLMKMYFLILYHKTHNPQNFLKTSFDDIRNRCMIKLSNDRILKQRLKNILNFLKDNNIIFDYTFTKKNITIQIHKQKEKHEIKTVLHIHTTDKKTKTKKHTQKKNESDIAIDANDNLIYDITYKSRREEQFKKDMEKYGHKE